MNASLNFSEKTIADLHSEWETIAIKYGSLVEAYVFRNYGHSSAEEHATHGFARRLRTLRRCIDNVFGILPPERVEIPTDNEISDAAINLQTFVFNVFGALDNLAWIWIHESGLKQRNGADIPDRWVGLGPQNTAVRESLSPGFQEYLTSIEPWFCHMADYRHALAHKISLYIPPHAVDPKNEHAYGELNKSITAATMRGNVAEVARLEGEQRKLCYFRPVIYHSLKAKGVYFHPKLLADFNTINAVALLMINELDELGQSVT